MGISLGSLSQIAHPLQRTPGEDSAGNRFNLLRWFSILSLLTILVAGAAMAGFLTRYLTAHMLMRDAEVSREFVESIIKTERIRYKSEGKPDGFNDVLDRLIGHIDALPDLVRANLFGPDRTVIWSREERLVGRNFDDNDELERAFSNRITVATKASKPEHVWLSEDPNAKRFVEAYLPIRDETGQQVLAVVEVYKVPHALFQAIDSGVRSVWTCAALGGLFLYGALFWIVRRADQIMRQQHDRIVEAQTMSAIGEMAMAVAHSIRNPLASIRSTAEIAQEEEGDDLQQCLRNIEKEADRLDGWVRELLMACRENALPVQSIDLNALISESVDAARPELQQRQIEVTLSTTPLPPVLGSRVPLAHAVRNILNNAIEAMPAGGRLQVESCLSRTGEAQILIEDSGAGMSKRVGQNAFRPLFTTKPNGIGLGLALARRIVERHAGRLQLDSTEGHGTRVVLSFPTSTGSFSRS